MLKILSGDQVKALDMSHVQVQAISSLDLMERAAEAFVFWWKGQGFGIEVPAFIFCGAGNNGGDGLAIARLLHQRCLSVTVFRCFAQDASLSADALANLSRLPKEIRVRDWRNFDPEARGVLVDAFFGSGLER